MKENKICIFIIISIVLVIIYFVSLIFFKGYFTDEDTTSYLSIATAITAIFVPTFIFLISYILIHSKQLNIAKDQVEISKSQELREKERIKIDFKNDINKTLICCNKLIDIVYKLPMYQNEPEETYTLYKLIDYDFEKAYNDLNNQIHIYENIKLFNPYSEVKYTGNYSLLYLSLIELTSLFEKLFKSVYEYDDLCNMDLNGKEQLYDDYGSLLIDFPSTKKDIGKCCANIMVHANNLKSLCKEAYYKY